MLFGTHWGRLRGTLLHRSYRGESEQTEKIIVFTEASLSLRNDRIANEEYILVLFYH